MSAKLGDITLTKQTGTTLTLTTARTYVETDVSFDLDVRSGVNSVTVTSTDAEIQSDQSAKNISSIFGTKTSSAPLSEYYVKVGAYGACNSVVTTSGWFETGSIGSDTASASFYFPVTTATATVSGTNTVTPSASISGTNIILSDRNNGISATATGGGTASAAVIATGNREGYAPSGGQLGTGTVTASSSTTTASSYISGVILEPPSSGTRSFTITLPNGASDIITLTITVDATGSWSIE